MPEKQKKKLEIKNTNKSSNRSINGNLNESLDWSDQRFEMNA